jgi:NhaP-type Na+/H+ or K+/H+ antiporter
MLAGVIMGAKITETMTGQRFGIMIYIWVIAHISRFLVVMIWYPVLVRWGYSWDIKKALLLTWGGLRGAVGLAVALILYESEDDQEGGHITKEFVDSALM